jgi:hypothetical protein
MINRFLEEIPNKSGRFKLICEEARKSSLSLLPFKYIWVPIDFIGVHELPNNLRSDQISTVIISFLKNGYRGPAISVIEHGRDAIYDALEKNSDMVLPHLCYGQIGIADGHNRLAALNILKSLHLLRLTYFPVQIIPGRKPDIVTVRTTNKGEIPLTIEEIESCFSDANKTIDPNSTSHFEAAFSDNKWRRVREGQPDIVIPKGNMIDLVKLRRLKNRFEIDSKIKTELETLGLTIHNLQQLILKS